MTESTRTDNVLLASIVIPTWNGERFISACLHSVLEQTNLPHEIIVVDNGSTDRTVQLVRQFGKAKLALNPTNMGFSSAINTGLAHAHGEILILMNQDVVAHSKWLEPIEQCFRNDPCVGMVGSKLLYPNGNIQHAGGYLLLPSWEGVHHLDDNPHQQIDFVTGAVMAIRRDCWQSVGAFDEGFYPAYFEDVDYCLRARKLGWKVSYEAESILTHHESASRSDGLAHVANFHTQRFRLVLKHQPLDWIWSTFLPNEQTRALSGNAPEWRCGLAHVFLQSALSLPKLRPELSTTECAQLVNRLLVMRDIAYPVYCATVS